MDNERARAEKYAGHLSRLIQADTVSVEDVREPEKFEKFHALLKEIFPDLFAVCVYENIEGSMLLKWTGKDPNKNPVLFMNHSDTVEAQGEWKHPPFSGDIAEGKVWGRGALDTKGGLWGMLEGANELAAEGFTPDRDIYFESSCCEEITSNGLGAELVAKVLGERGIHFSMILDEGGMIMFEPIGGVKKEFAMVGLGERGCSSLRFIARGNGGHASVPEKNSPLVRLGKFMAEADKNKVFDVEIPEPIKEMLRRFAPFVGKAVGHIYSDPDRYDVLFKKIMPSVSPTSRALTQTTLAFTMAQGSDGYNVVPAEASVVGNMRTSHHHGFEGSLEAISNLAKKYDIDTEVIESPEKTRLSDYNSKAFKLIEDAVSDAFPGVLTAPYIMTGCSDGRFMEKLGDNCFRFVPFLIDDEQMKSIHGLNECVDVSTLPKAVDFYKYVMRGLENV